jgi:hypothetical protein
MIDAKKLKQMDQAFQRILILPMTRSTFRQMQNVIFQTVEGNREEVGTLLEALLTNQKKNGQTPDTPLQEFLDRYSVPVSVAREVAERGEFVSLVTSDIINHPQMPIFGNRIRRVDGKEFDFISDAESCLQLLQHFSTRLQEMDKTEKAKNVLKGLKPDLLTLKKRVEELIASSEKS